MQAARKLLAEMRSVMTIDAYALDLAEKLLGAANIGASTATILTSNDRIVALMIQSETVRDEMDAAKTRVK